MSASVGLKMCTNVVLHPIFVIIKIKENIVFRRPNSKWWLKRVKESPCRLLKVKASVYELSKNDIHSCKLNKVE